MEFVIYRFATDHLEIDEAGICLGVSWGVYL